MLDVKCYKETQQRRETQKAVFVIHSWLSCLKPGMDLYLWHLSQCQLAPKCCLGLPEWKECWS